MRRIASLVVLGCVVWGLGCSTPAAVAAAGDALPVQDIDFGENPVAGDAAPKDGGQEILFGPQIPAKVCKGKGEIGECDTSDECASGQHCDPCTKVCAPERVLCDPCENDAQCKKALVDGKAGSVCLAYPTGNFCGLVCLGTAGCPQGFSCEKVTGADQMQCIPKTKSCAPGSGVCKADGDCPYTLVCNPEFKACVKGCLADESCPSGKVCSLGHCVPPCAVKADCSKLSAEADCVDQHCKIPGGCLSSIECVAPQTHCDLKSHKCVPGCEVDADCKDYAKVCEAGACVKKGCTENWQCAYQEICDVAKATCVKAEGPFCAPCDEKDDKVTACGGKPNACFGFKDAEDKDKGQFCGLVCGSEPGGPCPQGWACQELKDDKGAPKGKFCLRPCYTKPVGVP